MNDYATEQKFDSTPKSTSKLDHLAKACQSPMNRTKPFTELLPCISLIVEYRMTIRRLNREGRLSARDSERIANKVIEDNKAGYHLRVGDHALALCWAISPRNLFGLMILCAMSLSRSELYNMRKGTRAAFIMLFTVHWTPEPAQSGIPAPICSAVIGLARTIIPAAELMLCANLKTNKDQLRTFQYTTRMSDAEHFGFLFAGVHVVMPPTCIVSNNYIKRRDGDRMASLLKSSLVIQHPAPDNAHQCCELSSDTRVNNLYDWQYQLFHCRYSVLDNKKTMPLLQVDEDYLRLDVPWPSRYQDDDCAKKQALKRSLVNAVALLDNDALYAYDKNSVVIISQMYLDAYMNIDVDEDYNRSFTVEVWKQEEEDLLALFGDVFLM